MEIEGYRGREEERREEKVDIRNEKSIKSVPWSVFLQRDVNT